VIAAIGIAIVLSIGLTLPEKLMYSGVAASLPALCMSGCAAAIFQARNQLKPINLSRFGFELSKAFALASSAFILNDISLIGPTILIAAYLRCGFDLYFVRKLTNINFKYRLHSPKDYKRQIKLIVYGLPPLLISALTVPISIGDKIIINKLFGADSVAFYSLAFDISTKAYILVYAVNAAMLSVILHRHAQRSNTKTPLLVGLYSVTFLGIIFYLPLFIFASQIINYWLPNLVSSEISPLLRIMAVSSVIYLYGNVYEVSLIAMGRAKSVLFVYLVGVAFYWLAIFISSWRESFHGFLYSYLVLTIFLLGGFYITHKKFSKLNQLNCRRQKKLL
jgi:O-antigen/teichoic acid export membrane protein